MVFILENPLTENSYVFSKDGVYALKDVNISKHGSEIYIHKGHGIRIKQNIGFLKDIKGEDFMLNQEQLDVTNSNIEQELNL